jgi:hypothetical protein
LSFIGTSIPILGTRKRDEAKLNLISVCEFKFVIIRKKSREINCFIEIGLAFF